MSSIRNKEIMAKNLKRFIERSGKDRKELAHIWGFPYSTVTEWINGKKYPRIDRIEIMANYFGILKSDLIEEKTDQHREMSRLGNNIMNRRQELGMTQEELAKKMGYKSRSTINKIELGINDIPHSKIAMFAKVLETTPSVLLGWEQTPKHSNIQTDLIEAEKQVNIGAKIKSARQAKGLTQEDLGRIIGVQKSAVAKYENGRVVNIKRNILKKLSYTLDIPPFELVFDKELQKNNDTLTDIVLKAQSDDDFLYVIKAAYQLDREKLSAVKQMLTALLQ